MEDEPRLETHRPILFCVKCQGTIITAGIAVVITTSVPHFTRSKQYAALFARVITLASIPFMCVVLDRM